MCCLWARGQGGHNARREGGRRICRFSSYIFVFCVFMYLCHTKCVFVYLCSVHRRGVRGVTTLRRKKDLPFFFLLQFIVGVLQCWVFVASFFSSGFVFRINGNLYIKVFSCGGDFLNPTYCKIYFEVSI